MGVLCFGTCRLDPATGVLYANGGELWLPPKALELLEYLLQRPGVVVSRTELLGSIWKGRAVTDHSLTEAVCVVRESLDDDPRNPTYIQTIHRRGYRFVAAVQLERVCPTVQILPASCQSPDALADVTSATSVPGSIIGIVATGR